MFVLFQEFPGALPLTRTPWSSQRTVPSNESHFNKTFFQWIAISYFEVGLHKDISYCRSAISNQEMTSLKMHWIQKITPLLLYNYHVHNRPKTFSRETLILLVLCGSVLQHSSSENEKVYLILYFHLLETSRKLEQLKGKWWHLLCWKKWRENFLLSLSNWPMPVEIARESRIPYVKI